MMGFSTQSSVSQYFKGNIPLNVNALLKFCEIFGCQPNEISPSLSREIKETAKALFSLEEPRAQYIHDLEAHSGAVAIRKVIFKVSAGIAGFSVEYLDNGDGEPIFQPRSWFEKRGIDPSKVYAARVSGKSMEPKYFEGDVVMIDTGNTRRDKGAPFALNHNGEFVVKRLRYVHRRWWLASDNPDQKKYSPEECGDSTYIIGRIVLHVSETL